jgi:hypothetical protein
MLLPLILSLAPAANGGSADRGRLLYDNFCYHCHISEIHYRVGTEVATWADLLRAVAMWQAEMGLGWSAEDVADVASWLDRAYYGLADAPRTQ